MIRSRSDKSSSAKKRAESRIGRPVTSKMFFPPTFTASVAGRSREPPQSGQGTSRM